ncbi:prepilin-type N-terminal cleavage/methylation domain-containing protein [Alkanindiges illinoisensis]|uniref:Prepilin-type N-terminal cleavage/methylation domain-containing protein n=1 Tax=Alkanindiges illinoisensis TaxID=197183 RepID=A0A4Y7XDH0_9GAMM|nr:prepilin-type N-terminal cleavage/methylation domain-containing protein [Alkanindiges illinoisensis]TEU29267.1 prepilin-type N-terminal cleavage/methylation domain-containing protein [Alkanindiges illinoisensis]
MSNTDKRGFTLIEVMVVVVIVAILAAIAIPSYERYAIRAAQSQAKADMLAIAGQLENYRGKQLSFTKFVLSSKYNASNGVFYLPYDANSDTYKYQITLVDSKLPVGGTRVALDNDNAAGRGWVMIAAPNQSSSALLKRANYFMLTSTGIRCMTPESTPTKTYSLNKNSTGCEDGKGW